MQVFLINQGFQDLFVLGFQPIIRFAILQFNLYLLILFIIFHTHQVLLIIVKWYHLFHLIYLLKLSLYPFISIIIICICLFGPYLLLYFVSPFLTLVIFLSTITLLFFVIIQGHFKTEEFPQFFILLQASKNSMLISFLLIVSSFLSLKQGLYFFIHMHSLLLIYPLMPFIFLFLIQPPLNQLAFYFFHPTLILISKFLINIF